MFGRIHRLINNTLKLNEGEIFIRIMQRNDIAEYTLDLNRFEQLFMESVSKDGVDLPRYSRFTEDVSFGSIFTYKGRTRRKTRGDNMFLFDEGDFYASFRLTATADEMVIYAETIKERKNLMMYGNILGLTNESKSKLVEKIIPLIVSETRRRILQ